MSKLLFRPPCAPPNPVSPGRVFRTRGRGARNAANAGLLAPAARRHLRSLRFLRRTQGFSSPLSAPHFRRFAGKWRRERDSNPRYPFEVRRFSKALLSTTQPSLRESMGRKSNEGTRRGNPFFRRARNGLGAGLGGGWLSELTSLRHAPFSPLFDRFRAGRRGVAQPGSALRSGRRGRRFKSCHPDHFFRPLSGSGFFVPAGLSYRPRAARCKRG